MTKMSLFIAMILSAVMSCSSFASGYLQILGTGTAIQKIHAHSNGAITIWISPSENNNPDSCSDPSRVHIKKDNDGLQNMTSLVMAAYVSGKNIDIWSRKCEVIPFWGGTNTRAIVGDLWITD
jgi:hypothetical protein